MPIDRTNQPYPLPDSQATRDETTPSYPTAVDVTPGATVYTFDEEQLGKVAEVQGEHFRVDAPLRHDYWLSKATIRCSNPARVDLAYDSQQIGAYRLDSPAAAVDDPAEEMAVNPYPDPEAQVEAHEAMVEGYGHIDRTPANRN